MNTTEHEPPIEPVTIAQEPELSPQEAYRIAFEVAATDIARRRQEHQAAIEAARRDHQAAIGEAIRAGERGGLPAVQAAQTKAAHLVMLVNRLRSELPRFDAESASLSSGGHPALAQVLPSAWQGEQARRQELQALTEQINQVVTPGLIDAARRLCLLHQSLGQPHPRLAAVLAALHV